MFDNPAQLRVAERAYREALHQTPGDGSLHGGLGDILQALGRPDEAEVAYREAIRVDPACADPYNGLGDVLRELERPVEAVEAYREAIRLSPGSGAGEGDSAPSLVAIADSLKSLGKADEAVGKYREALAAAESGDGSELLAVIAASLDELGHYELAVAACREAMDAYGEEEYQYPNWVSDDLDWFAEFAEGLSGHGSGELAEYLIRSVIDVTGDLPERLVSLGRILQKMERFDEAIDAYRAAVDGQLHHDGALSLAETLVNLGNTLRRTERPDSAEKAYRVAIKASPVNAYAHNGLALALADLGDFSAAEEDSYREAIRLNPDNYVFHYNLGLTLYNAKRFEGAESEFTQAALLEPGDADVHRLLGYARQALGYLDEAATSYLEAISLDPDDTDTQQRFDEVLSQIAVQQEVQYSGQIAAQQETPHYSGQIADDLHALASWYAGAGLARVPLLGPHVPEDLPDDLAKLRALLLDLTALDILPASQAVPDVAAQLEAELGNLEGRDRAIEIFRRRTFAGEQETLDAVGRSWGVVRERARQIESKARTEFAGALGENEGLRVATAKIRGLIGVLLPLADLLRLVPALADEVISVGQPAWRVLATLDHAYEIEDGWCATPTVKGARTATGAWLREHANKHGVAGLAGFSLPHEGRHVAVQEETARHWLAYCDYQVHQDWIFTRTDSIGDRAAALLSVTGSPLSSQEILDQLPEDRALTSLKNALGIDERFVRVDRDMWALSEWGLESYMGIRDQIQQELTRDGGEISIDLLIERIVGRYSVAESSVRAYAGAPPFETSDGRVRFATAARVSGKTLTSTRHLYRLKDGWLYRVTIMGEHLRGSGSVASVVLATQAGLQRGSSIKLSSPFGPQLFSWQSLQPAFGSIQRFLLERNIVAGQEVFLAIGSDGSFDVRLVDHGRTSPLAAALSLTGCDDTDVVAPWLALAWAIGLPRNSSPASIIAGYLGRGDDDVADLLMEAHLE